MSVFIKKSKLRVKNEDGTSYTGVMNAIAEESTEELIKQIETKGNKTLESIPEDYTVLEGNVDKLKEDMINANNIYFGNDIRYFTPSQMSNGNVSPTNGLTTGDTYAIRTISPIHIQNGSFKVITSGDFKVYCCYYDNGNYVRINPLNSDKEYFNDGDYSVYAEGGLECWFVVAKDPLTDITTQDIKDLKIGVVINDNIMPLVGNAYFESRKGAKLLPNIGKWTEILNKTGEGILEHVFFAGDFPIYNTEYLIEVDGENLIRGYVYELIGLRNKATNNKHFGIKYFGITGDINGLYMNYKIPFYKSIKISIKSDIIKDNPYVWFTAKINKWHPFTIGGVSIPYGAKFNCVRKTKLNVESGTEFELYSTNKYGIILGMIMGGKGHTSNWFLEGMIREYDESQTPMLVSSGLEDYFLGTYYFKTGEYFLETGGCTYWNTEEHEFFAYRLHDPDVWVHGNNFKITLKNNDLNTEDATQLKEETLADYAYYVLNYEW